MNLDNWKAGALEFENSLPKPSVEKIFVIEKIAQKPHVITCPRGIPQWKVERFLDQAVEVIALDLPAVKDAYRMYYEALPYLKYYRLEKLVSKPIGTSPMLEGAINVQKDGNETARLLLKIARQQLGKPCRSFIAALLNHLDKDASFNDRQLEQLECK